MVIELRVVQFWSEIILVISNQTRTVRSFDFEITRMISDQIALHLVQLPLLIKGGIIIMIYTETLSTVILSVCNLIFSTNKETFASFAKMFNVS